MTGSAKLRHLATVGLILLVFAVYAPGLGGGFEFDDEPNIVRNEQLLITTLSPETLKQAALSMRSGHLMRPISYLTLALNHYFTGLDPWYFKLTNVLIHLFAGLAVYWLSRQLLSACRRRHQPALSIERIRWISLSATAFWLLHPLALTSVLYVIQRMNSLSALFVFLGLATYAWGRNRQIEGKNGWPAVGASVLVFAPLAALSKENGVLLPFLILSVEIMLFRFATPSRNARYALLAFFLVTAMIPALIAGTYLLTHTDFWLAPYQGRDFTLAERLLTQARAIWFYLRMIVAPDISGLGLFHDDFAVSTGVLSPPLTALALTGLVALLAAVWFGFRHAPMLGFGILFFLVGHSLESGIFALELVHEHRNYLPMFGLLLTLAYYIFHPGLARKTDAARIALAMAFVSVLSVTTAARANHWGNPLELALAEARNHPDSVRSQYRLGRVYWQLTELQPQHAAEYRQLAREHFNQATALDSKNTSGLFALVMLDSREPHPGTDEHVTELSRRLRVNPFAGVSYNLLRDLVQCTAEGRCKLAPRHINRIIASTLENHTIAAYSRAKVLAEATVVALLQDDQAGALKLAEEATRLDPDNPQHQLNYASMLIHSGQLADARTVLQTLGARKLPPLLRARLTAQEDALLGAERQRQETITTP